MTALTLGGMKSDVERFLHRHRTGKTLTELLTRFKCKECVMKDVLSFLSRNKYVKQTQGGVWKHTNWLYKK